MIDFEYIGYNNSAFDIGNHFCEWTFCYVVEGEESFRYSPEMYPSRAQQLQFVCAYLDARGLSIDGAAVLVDAANRCVCVCVYVCTCVCVCVYVYVYVYVCIR